MDSQQELLFFARPSLRRAFFFAFLYAGTVLAGRYQTNLDPRFNPIWWGCFFVLLAVLAVVHLRRWTTSYSITENEVRLRTGILARRAVVVPITRVTNMNADQSILERLLFLVNLRIDCPGGDSKEIFFARITKGEALKAADLVRELLHQASSSSQRRTKEESYDDEQYAANT